MVGTPPARASERSVPMAQSNLIRMVLAILASFTILERPSSRFEIVTVVAPATGKASAPGAPRQSRFAGRSRGDLESEMSRVFAPDAWQIRGSIRP
jgi:hypothetical protein